MKFDQPVYLVDGVRTPFAKMGTAFAETDAAELGRVAVAELLAQTGLDPATIEEVILGCVAQPADAANIARVIALRAGIPDTVSAVTVHRNCASGFESVTQAAEKMLVGRGDTFLVGGTENMSLVPLLYSETAARKFTALARAKTLKEKLAAATEFRPEDFKPRIGLQMGLSDPVSGLNMGQTAENVARDFGITREDQDRFSLQSHLKAVAARDKLKEEITPVYLPKIRNGQAYIDEDNGPRKGQTSEALAKLKPVFEKVSGSVTAGNASQITDGAVALLMMNEKALKASGLTPLGKLVSFQYAGCDPTRMGLGPVYAIHKSEERDGLGLKDADLIEVNEAFAAQVIGCQRAAKDAKYCREKLGRDSALGEIPDEILNVNGGAIALGHPVGVTGARLVLTALKELGRRKAKRALLSLCVGGGQGGALWVETV